MSTGGRLAPALAAATTSVLVGAALVATRSVASDIGPALLALLRYLIGGLCLVPFFLAGRRVRIPRSDLVRIAMLGVLQFAAVVGLLNYALRFIPSARAALIFSLCPVLTLGLEAALRRARPRPTTMVGVGLAVAGVAVAYGGQAIFREQIGGWTGDAAALGSAVVAALCSVLYRPYLSRHGALQVGVRALPAAVVVLAVAAGFEGVFTSPPRLPAVGWLVVGFIGLSSGLGYLLWLWALKHASPTRVTVFLTLNPIAAAGLGALFLGEVIGTSFVIGLACIVIGTCLAQRPAKGPALAASR